MVNLGQAWAEEFMNQHPEVSIAVTGGGFAAYDYVLWHPERLRSLVIAASGGAITDEEMRKLREKTTLPGFSSWPAEFREVSMGYMATNPEGLKQWLEIHHNSRQQGAPAQPQRTTITYKKLETIRVPTLLMPGDQDLQTPPWVMRRQLAQIPHAQFIVLPEAAHSINWSSRRLSTVMSWSSSRIGTDQLGRIDDHQDNET